MFNIKRFLFAVLFIGFIVLCIAVLSLNIWLVGLSELLVIGSGVWLFIINLKTPLNNGI